MAPRSIKNNNKNFYKHLKNWLLDLVFPKFCVGCGWEGTWLCPKCTHDILEVKSQVCPECGRLSENGLYCQRCRLEPNSRRKPLQGIVAAFYYEEGPIKEMVHNFKYNSILEFKGILGQGLAAAAKDLRGDIVTFTPLHPRRLSQRGYNQAEILAREASRNLKIPVQNLLTKTKHTKRQVGLLGSKRRKNLTNVFRSRKGIDIKNKKILIVDDITTTGTTLNECARVLKAAGAKEVWGAVIARG